MRLSAEQIAAMEKRLDEIQVERNQFQKQLMDEWVQEIAAHAEEAVKEDAEKLRAQAQDSMAKQVQAAAIERNKTLMEQAMKDSKERQDKRQKLMAELQSVTKERNELEGKMLDNISDFAAKLAVMNNLKMVLALQHSVAGIESITFEAKSQIFEVNILDADKPLVMPSSEAIDLTDELIKLVQNINVK